MFRWCQPSRHPLDLLLFFSEVCLCYRSWGQRFLVLWNSRNRCRDKGEELWASRFAGKVPETGLLSTHSDAFSLDSWSERLQLRAFLCHPPGPRALCMRCCFSSVQGSVSRGARVSWQVAARPGSALERGPLDGVVLEAPLFWGRWGGFSSVQPLLVWIQAVERPVFRQHSQGAGWLSSSA